MKGPNIIHSKLDTKSTRKSMCALTFYDVLDEGFQRRVNNTKTTPEDELADHETFCYYV